jgi:hypothetical protein
MPEDLPGSSRFDFGLSPSELEARRLLDQREQAVLEARLATLLNNADSYLGAADVAAQHARYQPFRMRKDGVVVSSDWIARRYRDEPRPVLARLTSRRSDIAPRVLLLTWLWGIEPWDSRARKMDWAGALATVESAENERGRIRGAHRALRIIEEETIAHDGQVAAWRQDHPTAELAWVYPARPEQVYFPPEFFEQGWHLALTKSELSWYAISSLQNGRPATSRMRNRYVGFSKHVTGSDWLTFNTVLDAIWDRLDAPAPNWMARIILESLGRPNHAYGEWPRIREFAEDEYPYLVVKGRTTQGKPAVLIGTNKRWHYYRTWVRGKDFEILEHDERFLHWRGELPQQSTHGTHDRRRKLFFVHGPSTLPTPDNIIIKLRDVTHVLGEASQFQVRP